MNDKEQTIECTNDLVVTDSTDEDEINGAKCKKMVKDNNSGDYDGDKYDGEDNKCEEYDGEDNECDDNECEEDDGEEDNGEEDDDNIEENNMMNNDNIEENNMIYNINTGGPENEVLRGRVMNNFNDIEWTQAEHSELYFAAMTLRAKPIGSRTAVEEEKVWFEFLEKWIEMKKSIYDSGMRDDEVGTFVFPDGSRPSSTWVEFHKNYINRYYK
jgi:hypothetical protein